MKELLLIGIAQTIFASLFVLTKRHRTLSDGIFIAWLISLTMPLVLQVSNELVLPTYLPLNWLNLFYSLTFGPFLWLFINSLIGRLEARVFLNFIHFVPFVLVTVLQVSLNLSNLPEQLTNGTVSSLIGSLIGLCNVFSLLCYSLVSLWRLNEHRKEVLENFSSLTTNITLSWLFWLIIGFTITYLLPLFVNVIPNFSLIINHNIALICFIYLLTFFGLKQVQIFTASKTSFSDNNKQEHNSIDDAPLRPVPVEPKNDDLAKTSGKYQHSGLTQDRALSYLQKLREFTEKECPYLDANLTVDKLSKQLHIPRHYLTQIFSEQLNKSFYLYINEYRINHVKQLLNDPKYSDMTLLDIAYQSGFNSKSTFNSVFKKITNMTPSQYRKANFDC